MFITLEGMEGSGKSTLLRELAQRIQAAGRDVLTTREPGGSELGRHLRALLLAADSDVTPEAELFLFLADRAQHVARIIRPALAQGMVVLCDRYVDSTLVYQGVGRGFAADRLRLLCDMATGSLWPDLTLVLDLDVTTGLARATARHQTAGSHAAEGRFEAEALAFHDRVRQGFAALAAQEPARVRLLDAAQSPQAVLAAACAALAAQGLPT